jgi:hypothetical protein
MGLFKVQESAPAPRGGRVASRFVPDSLLEVQGFELGPADWVGAGAASVQLDFFCSAGHSMEPGAHAGWVG